MTRLIFPADRPPFASASLYRSIVRSFGKIYPWAREGKSGQKCSRALHDIQSGSIGWGS